ncbi:hypothetical protein DAEQUDRAFT_812238 [Daedalea quercina L-15889]|uniref:Uncharacterized protein n=1 Tax=Daedalea quercina L-15889 TaxID=1314783 RepID=A0A165PJ70_9APHY|nr:hypothetical protein DAEQUDRAFT_812238 [Daedalea quercina L-15889]
MATSAIRRKPMHTYKSPSFETISDPLSHTAPRVTPRDTSGSSTPHSDKSIIEVTRTVIVPYANMHAKHRQIPSLPLYHPLGPFALSLPQLDPGLFGLSHRITVDDAADEPADSARRSSSRARRPAAKVRERDDAGEDDAVRAGAQGQSAPLEAGGRAPGSPRKKRAGGSGGGARRKRKAETEDVDGAYPPPTKRTRNPRGAGNATPAVASPLVSEAVVATIEEAPEREADAPQSPEGVEAEEIQAEQPVAPAPKRARTRKARAPANKRRNSSASASTSTSVSVSIAANTRTTRAKAARESASDGDAEKKGEEGAGGEGAGKGVEAPQEQAEGDGAAPTSPVNQLTEDATKPEEEKSEKMEVDAPPAAQEPSPVSAPAPAPVASPAPEKEEKEEGELSDEH